MASNALYAWCQPHWLYHESGAYIIFTVDPKVTIPSFFRQVTRGHNTSVIHAYYESVYPLVNGRYLPGDVILNSGDHHFTKPRPDGRKTVIGASSIDAIRYVYWAQIELDVPTRYYGEDRIIFDESGNYIIQTRSVIFSTPFIDEDVPSFETIHSKLEEMGANWSISTRQWVPADVDVAGIPDPVSAFRFAEPSVSSGKLAITEGFFGKQIQLGLVACCEELFDDFGNACDNSIQNVVEAAKFLMAAARGRVPRIGQIFDDFDSFWLWFTEVYYPKIRASWVHPEENLDRVKRWWLSFRYQFGTGMMDYKQASDYLAREVSHYARETKYHSTVTRVIDGIEVAFRLSVKTKPREDDILTMLSHRAWMAGVEPNAYVIWDMIPLSFMVDWFLDIGGALQYNNQRDHFFADYNFYDICWSISYRYQTLHGTVPCYFRWYGGLPAKEGFNYYSSYSPSLGTQVSRFTDAGAILLR